MSTDNRNPAGSNKPSHIAYLVQDREGKESFWTRIGGAWAHADSKGFTLQLSVVPLDGRITLRVASDKKSKK